MDKAIAEAKSVSVFNESSEPERVVTVVFHIVQHGLGDALVDEYRLATRNMMARLSMHLSTSSWTRLLLRLRASASSMNMTFSDLQRGVTSLNVSLEGTTQFLRRSFWQPSITIKMNKTRSAPLARCAHGYAIFRFYI
jgi:hypothetical protein